MSLVFSQSNEHGAGLRLVEMDNNSLRVLCGDSTAELIWAWAQDSGLRGHTVAFITSYL